MATSCEEPIGDMDSYRTALNNLACALSSIKTELEGIREQATTGGLTVSWETALEPMSFFPLMPDPSSSAAMKIYEDIFRRAGQEVPVRYAVDSDQRDPRSGDRGASGLHECMLCAHE